MPSSTSTWRIATLSENVPNQDYSQDAIYLVLTNYLASKAKKISAYDAVALKHCVLDKNLEIGLCNGLTHWWLYNKACGTEQQFFDQIAQILSWDQQEFDNVLEKKEDPFIEEFLNTISVLHCGSEYLHNFEYYEMHEAIDFLLPDCMPKLNPPEFFITFAFNSKTLASLLNEIISPNKIIRIDNGFHCIGLFSFGNTHYFRAPEYKQGAKAFTSTTKLAKAILRAFAFADNKSAAIAMNIQIFDFKGMAPYSGYASQLGVMLAIFKVPEFKQQVLQNSQIFHLGAKYHDYELLKFLFANGYQYIPWKDTKFSEYDLAITKHNEAILNLLLGNGINPNFACDGGITPVGQAILRKNYFFLHKILLNGADPNLPINYKKEKQPKKLKPPILYAAKKHQVNAVLMLLRFGARIDSEIISGMRLKLNESEFAFVMQSAPVPPALTFSRSLKRTDAMDIAPEQTAAKRLIF